MRFAENTQHTSKVLRVPRKMTSKVLRLPRKMQLIFLNRRKSIAPAAQNDFLHVMKHAGLSRSATPAMRNEVMRHLKPPRVTTFAELAIGTAIRASRDRLRPVASGCGRLRNVWRTQPPPPDPQSETGTRAMHSGKTEVDKGAFWFQDHTTEASWHLQTGQTMQFSSDFVNTEELGSGNCPMSVLSLLIWNGSNDLNLLGHRFDIVDKGEQNCATSTCHGDGR